MHAQCEDLSRVMLRYGQSICAIPYVTRATGHFICSPVAFSSRRTPVIALSAWLYDWLGTCDRPWRADLIIDRAMPAAQALPLSGPSNLIPGGRTVPGAPGANRTSR